MPCKCDGKRDGCLTLECSCFAGATHCDASFCECNCSPSCGNTPNNEVQRSYVIRTLLQQDGNVFKSPQLSSQLPSTSECLPKQSHMQHGDDDTELNQPECACAVASSDGLCCLNAASCACFAASVLCSDRCSCAGPSCGNHEQSEALLRQLSQQKRQRTVPNEALQQFAQLVHTRLHSVSTQNNSDAAKADAVLEELCTALSFVAERIDTATADGTTYH